MAGRKLRLPKSGISVSAATAKTVLQIKAVNVPVRLLRVSIGQRGTSATDAPALLELVRQTSAGTMSALTPRLADNGITYTPNLVAQHTATAEPTDSGVIIWSTSLHPQEMTSLPFSEILDEIVDVGTWLGFRVTASANNTVDPELVVEE